MTRIVFHKHILVHIFIQLSNVFVSENCGNILTLQLGTDKYATDEMSSYKHFKTRKKKKQNRKSTSSRRLPMRKPPATAPRFLSSSPALPAQPSEKGRAPLMCFFYGIPHTGICEDLWPFALFEGQF